MLKIAHVSDLHLLSPAGIEWRRILVNKRLTGVTKLLLHRARMYNAEFLEAVLESAAAAADHLVVTGDLSNLSLDSEFADAQRLLDRVAQRVEVTVIPGNHDLYLQDIVRKQRFVHYFEQFMRTELREYRVHEPAGLFPFVKLRGPVALVGLSSAVPRPPFVSAGYVGHGQLAMLRAILDLPQVASRTPVILVHHDPFDSRYRLEQLRSGLVDAARLRAELSTLSRGMILFGHLHIRRYGRLQTANGSLDAVCASGASLEHPDDRVRAGFNLYTVQDDGAVGSIVSWVIDPASRRFVRHELRTDARRA